jgi:hypothetical protein
MSQHGIHPLIIGIDDFASSPSQAHPKRHETADWTIETIVLMRLL